MCGIYGRIGARNDDLDWRALLSLQHRGPDDVGLMVDQHCLPGDRAVVLGHTRLSILDLSRAGHQPMYTADQRLVISYNGEIYNFQQLREDLARQGYEFQSSTDTEVLLYLYQEYGDAMLDMLDGMYAFAILERDTGRLLLARDPSGIKPLYYRLSDAPSSSKDELAFASEIKALLVDPRFERKPDLRVLAGYLSYLYTPPPGTAFEGIHNLLPGHTLVFENGKATISRFHYFRPEPKHDFASTDDAIGALESLLVETIEQHMIADVPLGAFLSGGVDSGLMVALMARIKRDRGDTDPVRTFTIGFSDKASLFDESEAAAAIAKHIGTDHQFIQVGADLAADRFTNIAQQFDEPFAIPTALLHDALCEATRREVTVALAGDGGDEAFGGYPRYRAIRALSLYHAITTKRIRGKLIPKLAQSIPERADGNQALRRIRRFFAASGHELGPIYRDWITFYSPSELTALLSEESLAGIQDTYAIGQQDLGGTEASFLTTHPGADVLDQACMADIAGFLPNNVLHDSDRSSMRVALEVRVPYADRRVIDFGLRLPIELKVAGSLSAMVPGGRGLTSKKLLRLLSARYLPKWSSLAPKQGFVAPMGTWLNGSLRELLEESTRREVVEARGLVRPEAIERIHAEHKEGRRDRTWHLWAMVVLESWFRLRIDTLDLPEVDYTGLKIDECLPLH